VPSTFPGFGAADLFDEAVVKKPAYLGVVAALSESNATKAGAIFKPVNGTTNAVATGTRNIVSTGTGLSSPRATGLFTGNGVAKYNPLKYSSLWQLSLFLTYVLFC